MTTKDAEAMICPNCGSEEPNFAEHMPEINVDSCIIRPVCQNCSHQWTINYAYESFDPNQPRSKSGFYTVTLVMRDRAYGGSEEGGWWYGTVEPVTSSNVLPVIAHSWHEACQKRDEMETLIETLGLNVGRAALGSVMCQGIYDVHIFDGYPKSLPEERPYYE